MKILALDTATEACSAAILDGTDIHDKSCIAPREHSQLIMKMIDDLLRETNLKLADLDGLAFGRGPGAFTGIRIAAGVAQGLAYGANLPVIPVSTLAALALASDITGQYIYTAIDARMGEVYWAIFERDGEGLVSPVTGESVTRPDVIAINLQGRFHGVGSGWDKYHSILETTLGDRLTGYSENRFPQAREIVRLAEREIEKGNILQAGEALPVYIRNSVTG